MVFPPSIKMISRAFTIAVLISFQSVLETTCFLSNPFNKHNSHSYAPTSSNTLLKQFKLHIKPPNWDDDASSRDTNIKIGSELIHRLDSELGSIVSSLTIDTVTYYMLEFRNDVLQRWMVNFANYSNAGFPNNDWTEYLERMIKSGDEKIQVIMKPPQNFIRGKSANIGGSNVVIQYDFDVEPRKVANQILTVRENVCDEIIHDLHSIEFENEEALRYATTLAQDINIHSIGSSGSATSGSGTSGGVSSGYGNPSNNPSNNNNNNNNNNSNSIESNKEKADKQRKMTRMSSQSGSTPNRDRNFNEMDRYITDLAIQLVIDDYNKVLYPSSSSSSLSGNNINSNNKVTGLATTNNNNNNKTPVEIFLESFILKIENDTKAQSVSDQFFSKQFGTRTFLEQLFYKGITEGATGSGVVSNESIYSSSKPSNSNNNNNNVNNKELVSYSNNNNDNNAAKGTINVLKLAKSIAETRVSLALQAQGVLRMQNSNNRKYYKMIKDYGGVLSLMRDQVKRQPKFTLLDLDEEKRRQQNTAKSLGLADGVRVSGAAGGDDIKSDNISNKVKEKESVTVGASASSGVNNNNNSTKATTTIPAAVKQVVKAKKEEEEESYFESDFGNMGPMLM